MDISLFTKNQPLSWTNEPDKLRQSLRADESIRQMVEGRGSRFLPSIFYMGLVSLNQGCKRESAGLI